MPASAPTTSARRTELLELAYRYGLQHGVAEMSLRPLAAAIGSSPRVLLFLFGSKDGLVRALLARARQDELALLDRIRSARTEREDLIEVAGELWGWLAADEHRGLLTLWLEGYARSLIDPDGPWADFARTTVADWLAVLAEVQPTAARRAAAARRDSAARPAAAARRDSAAEAQAKAERTLVLAVLRGAMLDLLATGDLARTTDAVHRQLALMRDAQ